MAAYSYDFAGRRVSKTVSGSPNVTTKYCYDGEQVIAEYAGSTLVKKFVYGPGIDEPICMIDVDEQLNETFYYYHFDGLGSVVTISDDSGDTTLILPFVVFKASVFRVVPVVSVCFDVYMFGWVCKKSPLGIGGAFGVLSLWRGGLIGAVSPVW
ncbi:MAG: hypothetical protein DRP74_08765 [Candidatus Omnitrophota bacterium]|nr:MAG: hypothetical protein DRP74_08765 [Candidatus Omnitrophota bacterium]